MLNHQVQNVSATLSDGTSRPIGRNFIQIIIWISLCSVTAILVSSRGLAVSSSTSKFDLLKSNEESTEGLENTCVSTRRNDIRARISRPSVAISFRLSSEFHCARCDKHWAERRPDLRSQFHSDYHLNFIVLDVTHLVRNAARTFGRNFIQIIIWISLCSMSMHE